MKYTKHVDVWVQNSGSFVFDHYAQGLRRFVRSELLVGDIGSVRDVTISPHHVNEKTTALLLGETNRMNARYELVSDLLNAYTANSRYRYDKTAYFNSLFAPYKSGGWARQIRGRKEIKRKTNRVIKIYEWLSETGGDISGINSYLSKNGPWTRPVQSSPKDYPLCIQIENRETPDSYVQLDGSHRRCVASYLGYTSISSLTVTLDEVEDYLSNADEPYLSTYSGTFFRLLRNSQMGME